MLFQFLIDKFQFLVFPIFIAVLHQTKRLVEEFSILLICSTTGRIGQ